MRKVAVLLMAAFMAILLGITLPVWADDTVSLGVRDLGGFPIVHGQEHPLVFKHDATYRMTVSVVGPDHDKVNQIRVLIGGREASGRAGRRLPGP